MGQPLFTNNASGTLAASYSNSATALTLTAGQGALFPAPTGSDYFYATIVDASNNIEIVKVTAKVTDTFTVVRAQEGTTAMALSAGWKIAQRLTAASLAAIRDEVVPTAKIADAAITTAKIVDANVTTAKIADAGVTTVKIADANVTAPKLAAGVALSNLGYTPIQQGGGTGMDTTKLYVGWSGAETKLKFQLDATPKGNILLETATAEVDSAGYRGTPQVAMNASSAFGLTHNGKQCLHDDPGTHVWTIPAEATTAFQNGVAMLLANLQGTVTLTPAAGVTLIWALSGSTGSRTLAANGLGTLTKVGTDKWMVAGVGLT